MLPQTPLLLAPTDLDNPFGRGMWDRDLIKGLQKCNPAIVVPHPSTWRGWYPGLDMGVTSIWLGQPGIGTKICSFTVGFVPEFTLLGPRGTIVARGWRSILSKVILYHVASKERVERIFNTTLVYSKPERLCPKCRKDGDLVRADGKSPYCESHRAAQESLAAEREFKKEVAYNVR